MSKPFTNDMIDFFKLVQDAVEGIVLKAEQEGWDENKLIDTISGII